jgi:hypothetical protein
MEKLFQGPEVNSDADHTYLMFSATFPKSARRLAKEYMEEETIKVKVGRVGSTHQNIKQQIVYVNESEKNQALFDLIFSGEPGRTLIFTNTKVKCDMVDDFLYNKGLPVTSIHADRTQREREDAMYVFPRYYHKTILTMSGVHSVLLGAPSWSLPELLRVVSMSPMSSMSSTTICPQLSTTASPSTSIVSAVLRVLATRARLLPSSTTATTTLARTFARF